MSKKRKICAHITECEIMFKTERRDEILQFINSKGKVSVEEISEKIYASPSTVRRDLEKLEAQGLILRYHGGAESAQTLRPPQIIRHQHNQKEKRLIAERAAKLVFPETVIFIDASTTVQYMIPCLAGIKNLTVYTNGADTAMRLAEHKIRVICTGGELKNESMAYVGQGAIDSVRKVYFDAMFFSSAAFDEYSVSDWSESETELRRIVAEQSARRYFLADLSKKGKRFPYIVCKLHELDAVICE